MKHTKKWFLNRIGKRIYRHTKRNCCPTCDHVEEQGLIIRDESHADYLHMVQGEMNLKYSDNKTPKRGLR